jgi:hypothetical protein
VPLPQTVLDFIASLQIVGVPTAANPGDTIAPRLTPNPVGLQGLVNPEVLAELDLALILDEIALDLGDAPNGPNAGTAGLDIVLKAVEFPPPADLQAKDVGTGEAATRALPHLVPQPATGVPPYVLQISPDVEGLLGRLTGSVEPLRSVVGSVAGKITGTLVRPGVLAAPPVVKIEWRVEDANGRALDATEVISTGTAEAPSFVFLPDFMEAGNNPSTLQRRLFCDVEVKKATNSPADDTVKRAVGPVTIDVPRIPFPTVMVLTQHAVGGAGFPGAVLVAVPGTSLVHGPDQVGTLLQPARQVLQTLSFLAQFTGAATAIDSVTAILSAATKIAFVPQDVVNDLWTVMRTPGGVFGFGYESWEDVISSLVLVGPPGRTVSLHNRKNTWVGTGAFSIGLGLTGTATVGTFAAGTPACTPASSTLTVITPSDIGTFNDVVSSYKFWPL